MGTAILGTGSCLPERVLSNVELEQIVDTNDEWIRTRTGIENRRIGASGEFTYQIAAQAARRALEMAGVGAEQIRLLVVGTISSHMLMPSCACFVQQEIGAHNAFAYDINAACSGFLYGMDIADKHIRADRDAKVLVIGAETLSSRLNWQDRNTCILFGDGAGAAVFGHVDAAERLVLGTNHYSDGRLWQLLYMHQAPSTNPDLLVPDNPGVHIIMEGREVFKHAVKAMEEAVGGLLDRVGMTIADVDLMIPHQANIRILKKLMERLEIPEEKVVLNVMHYGNTSAASIPIALDETNRAGRLRPGTTVLFCSFGGGFTWGATLLKW
ncbi:beta-ketoacyl-ACP synthase III [Desulfofustis limnaeus]|jgi:3-oxoacyl-[acyl-carrier-protein] synthase-3|uniref:Beta-ketoacyl-[acyl-carrier-protein] synthase III n=1 Tax=Desulfofustis limnaeus TaxID=2740163 RepID=A0ABN6M1G5_9BACT|nr:beta-ketoacyl-ACP synthase III [Desulfofustis limnaeus]MDX9895655.1 beta-ketoacyl-ACP synthase III [Desulfofustis sp.]BDD86719.1 3-oxoacyl-[acyl-carrier-protein] synthase 3 [Desulfofustis limnaeus]